MSASMFDSCSFTHQFKINLAETKDVAIGHFVSSDDISAGGGHLLRIDCYPRGIEENDKGDAPFSDIGRQLGLLLDSADGSDVPFIVGGEDFPAHWAVLAARSPVFKAQLLGSMAADAKMAPITLHDIAPTTFRDMLRFIYTDDFYLPEDEDGDEDDELDGSPADTIQDLFAAADRYALDRLKLLCAKRLWDDVSVETVAATLACAETYNCSELKNKCIDFFADEKNFKKAVLTDGFAELVHKFPAIIAELREKVEA